MILNQQFKFLFIKTRKTGGTSLEIALSKFAGPQDIITPIEKDDEATKKRLGFRGPQNFMNADGTKAKAWNHITAAEIRSRLSEKAWDSLYKFSIVRNPFSKAVSGYFWNDGPNRYSSFFEYLKNNSRGLRQNWDTICIDGKPALDKVIRYENLHDDLAEVSETLKLPENVHDVMSGIRAKGQYRPQHKPIREYYEESDKARQLVELLCEDELAYFNYSLDDFD